MTCYKPLQEQCLAKISRFYYYTHYVLNINNKTIYCQPCQHFTNTLVHCFVPIIMINNEDFTLLVMAVVIPSIINNFRLKQAWFYCLCINNKALQWS